MIRVSFLKDIFYGHEKDRLKEGAEQVKRPVEKLS